MFVFKRLFVCTENGTDENSSILFIVQGISFLKICRKISKSFDSIVLQRIRCIEYYTSQAVLVKTI